MRDAELTLALPPVRVHRIIRAQRAARLGRDERERLRWGEKLLRLPAVWARTRGAGVRVAVLDTGIDPDHPDLAEAIDASRDFTGAGIEDLNGHGTHAAGIVAARRNELGFVGVAPECRLLVGKVLRNDGSGTLDAVAAGIDWAVGQGAHIVSMSLGSPAGSSRLYEAVHAALARGVILVCAAGNAGALGRKTIGYPARYGSVLTIGAHDRNGLPSGFSSRGAEIDFVAPGEEIWSTWKEGGFAKLSGTSMATPFAAGVAALVLAKHLTPGFHRTPIFNCDDMREHLLRMAAHPGHHDPASGHGPLLPFLALAEVP